MQCNAFACMLRIMSDEESIFRKQVLMIKSLFVKTGKVTIENFPYLHIPHDSWKHISFLDGISFFWNYFSGTVSFIL